jgi:membrane protein DedA with SNARE-associated domain
VNNLLSFLPAWVTQNPLPFAFAFLLLFGFTLPICEEIAVALVGVTVHATHTYFLSAVGVALLAILIQDSGYFLIARIFGPRIIRHRLVARLIKPKSIEGGERYFLRRGPAVVFSSRFVVGLRAPVIVGAGFLRMRWSRFVLYDFLAAMIMTPAWLFVGFSLGAQFSGRVGFLTKFFAILGPIAIVTGAILIYRSVKADKAAVEAGTCTTKDTEAAVEAALAAVEAAETEGTRTKGGDSRRSD